MMIFLCHPEERGICSIVIQKLSRSFLRQDDRKLNRFLLRRNDNHCSAVQYYMSSRGTRDLLNR